MTIRLSIVSLLTVSALIVPAPLLAQAGQPPAPAPASPPAQRARGDLASLEVLVVISRFQDQKQVSSLPYTLAVTANAPGAAQLNMGTEVPVPTTTFPPAAPQPPGGTPQSAPRPVATMSYRSVGTLISCRAAGGEGGQFEVNIDVDDSSIFTSDQTAEPMQTPRGMPVFRSFKSRNTLLLRDGQSRQYTAAADRVTGEVVRVEVTLRVVK